MVFISLLIGLMCGLVVGLVYELVFDGPYPMVVAFASSLVFFLMAAWVADRYGPRR